MAHAQSNCFTYVVKTGDTLFRLARANGTTVETLASSNSIPNPNLIYIGQRLSICPGLVTSATTLVTTSTTTTTNPTTTTTSTTNPILNPNQSGLVSLPLVEPPPPGGLNGCPFIANGVFVDCGSYYMEQAANRTAIEFGQCVPYSLKDSPIPNRQMQCATTGDRWLLLDPVPVTTTTTTTTTTP
jgi:hypothetical protein